MATIEEKVQRDYDKGLAKTGWECLQEGRKSFSIFAKDLGYVRMILTIPVAEPGKFVYDCSLGIYATAPEAYNRSTVCSMIDLELKRSY